ncbi:MAG: sensor histidine kinase [Pseudomonadota bacterium]
MSSTQADTPAAQRDVGSLTWRLLRSMTLPLLAVALLLGIGGSWAIDESVEAVNDRILSAASRAIAESLTWDDGEISLDLSPAIFGMLENNERDNVYYSVRYQGRVITGYADLPNIAPPNLRDTQVMFGKSTYLGRPIRIVAEGRQIPGIAGPVVVQVAETLEARERLTRDMLIGLAVLEAALIGMTLLLLPLAVRWGLRPLLSLRDEMDRRSASDLAPLPLTGTPRELRDLVSAFNAMLGRLDVAVGGLRRFTADASHQMRTPLSILRGHIALLRGADLTSKAAQTSIEDIDRASARLSRLLVQLLALARADGAASARAKLEPVDMNAVAAEVVADHVVEALRAGIDVQLDRRGKVAMATTHALLAAELLSNLLDNSVRYNHPGGTVVVSVEAAAGQIVVAIEDDGPGIADEDRERMFGRFSRLDRSDMPDGSGLGLSIARSLADAIDAQIALDTPKSGKGLRAEVRFTAVKA